MSGILVVSFSEMQPEELIRNILGENELPKSEDHYSHIKSYPWHLETKYYTVDLFLHTVEDIIACQEFVDTVEAIIIHFDPSKEKSFQNLQNHLQILEAYEAEVQILACDSLSEVREDRSNKYLEWCVKNKYELVELSASDHGEETDDEEKDDYEEITGYRRILGALQAHVWPSLKMKDMQETMINLNTKAELRLHSAEGSNASCEKKRKEKELTKNDRIDALLDNELLQSLEKDDDSLSFEELFQKFSEMKEKADNLTGEERKRYAEKVTIAFWKAIGGDEEEIAGLSDGD